MLFAEQYARLLLVVHTVLGAAVVAASTHLVVWMRGFPRGTFQRLQAVRRFAVISAALFVLAVLGGNLIYPVYKVRVRVEYLERPDAVIRDHRSRLELRARIHDEHGPARAGEPPADTDQDAAADAALASLPHQTMRIARWFDVKEHWAALGAALAVGCAIALRLWNPRRHGPAIATLVFLMALGAAATAWLGAIIGIVVSSYRAIG